MTQQTNRRIDRASLFINLKRLNEKQVTEIASLSVGAFTKARKPGKDLSLNACYKLLETFPELNKVWLLTGEGEMTKGSPHLPSHDSKMRIEVTENDLEDFYKPPISHKKHTELKQELKEVKQELLLKNQQIKDLLQLKQELLTIIQNGLSSRQEHD